MRHLPIAVLVLALAVGASACGGGSGDTVSSSSASSATSTTGQTPSGAAGYTLTGQARAAGSTRWTSYPAVKVTCGSSPAVSVNPYHVPPKTVCGALASYLAAPTRPCTTQSSTAATGRVLIVAEGASRQVKAVLPPFASCHLNATLEQRDTVISAIAFRTSPG